MRPFTDSYNSITVINLSRNATWRRTRIHVGHVCFTSRLEVIRRRANTYARIVQLVLSHIHIRAYTCARTPALGREYTESEPECGTNSYPIHPNRAGCVCSPHAKVTEGDLRRHFLFFSWKDDVLLLHSHYPLCNSNSNSMK